MILYRGSTEVRSSLTRKIFASLASEYAGLSIPWDGSNCWKDGCFSGASSGKAISFRLYRDGINEECTLEGGRLITSLFSKEIPRGLPRTFAGMLSEHFQRDRRTGWRIQAEPQVLGMEDADSALLLQDGTERPSLPVIYVTRSYESYRPLVDTAKLAADTAGLFMVFEESDTRIPGLIRKEAGNWKPPFNGSIDIYWPEGGWSRLNAQYLDPYGSEEIIRSRLIRLSSCHRYGPLEISQPSIMLEGLIDEVRSGEKEKTELSMSIGKLHESFAAAEEAMKDEYEEYTSGIEDSLEKMELRALEAEEENARLKEILEASGRRGGHVSLEFSGDEFYPGEVRDVVLKTLRKTADAAGDQNMKERRSHQVLLSLLEENRESGTDKKLMDEMENAILGTGKTVKADEKTMARLGFRKSAERQGTHVKYLYHGDPRYTFVLSSTPSDVRTARNKLTEIIQRLFR